MAIAAFPAGLCPFAKDLYRELGTVTATPDEAPPGIRVLPSGSRLKPLAI